MKFNRRHTHGFDRQAAGHEGSVLNLSEEGDDGAQSRSILKRLQEEEVLVYESIYSQDDDPIQEFIPEYFGEALIEVCSKHSSMSVNGDDSTNAKPGDRFIRLSNCLAGFNHPLVMDIKMGVRSFVEEECTSLKPRPDLYERMLASEPSAPTEEEKVLKSITKHRWMTWRDQMSSSHSLGFRIDGIAGPADAKLQHSDFMYVREREHVVRELLDFLPPPRWRSSAERKEEALQSQVASCLLDSEETLLLKLELARRLRERLQHLQAACEASPFFKAHEFVGASLLLAAEANPMQADIFLIDFAKTRPLPEGVCIDHRQPWVLGNHEDGFLFGLENCIKCWDEVIETLEEEASKTPSLKMTEVLEEEAEEKT
eukprot:CAMPEP_0206539192 /NCGR_PEP_ID=MMETSP0325_2-20121206/8298_1 /ASSEMBLY_ACC=CAM_ASM_000347 /TAXON_ID=2866 /ORGANISM="Crypthecodinium cohnii, Strain Seligo" /LENGTH=370 /DNA_ID=CAMNT_0054036747 /DNA_START=532 /DNA_END=1644 /DNA_ORIENTATION=-